VRYSQRSPRRRRSPNCFPAEYAAILLRTRDRLKTVCTELAPQLAEVEDSAEAERLMTIA
jgi:hypothetical protein